jgi:hypothetical protein
MALPSLIGAALSHVPPERAGAAAGLTLLLPRRAAGRQVTVPPERAAQERAAEYSTEAVH